jgi:hypothetical protein
MVGAAVCPAGTPTRQRFRWHERWGWAPVEWAAGPGGLGFPVIQQPAVLT